MLAHVTGDAPSSAPGSMIDARAKTVAIVGFPDVEALDVVGPFDAFAMANTPDTLRYRCVLLAPSAEAFVTTSGLRIAPDASLAQAPRQLDTVLIAGGRPIRSGVVRAEIAAWLERRASSIRRIGSICTGLYGLAASGLMDGRRAATHWRFAGDVAREFPRLKIDADSIFVNDGRFWTSAGVTAGIDLALALIEKDYGADVALAVARDLVVYLKRDGGQAQYSTPLKFQINARDKLATLVAWMVSHPREDLSVEALAARLDTSVRHVTRKFKDAFGLPPGRVVESLRLDAARQWLLTSRRSIDDIGDAVGFRSADVFRRAFERRFGTTPSNYRARFEPLATTARSSALSSLPGSL
jgi:transcriptional regulator GlxA family with amidase domain